ncbi:MAG: TonB-dependent receptor [Bacteroides sp.]|nr:TonB-dependent receptor [Bacteroides sp.]MCM1413450.1 TonB-dependent receptor [Bacteroides sp.]MCM1471339.1 TonB-dependent receptor [Bacteroides sp.]
MAASVNIRGRVVDQANEPIVAASVKVVGTSTGTTTNTDGNYKLSVAQRDTIVIQFSCIGYNDERRTLVKPSGDLTINIRLREKSVELSGVEVTDMRRQTDAMQRMSTDDYRRAADASGNTVESMIQTLAGVSSSNELSSQYSVRGGTYDENSVRINGIEVYRPQLISSGQQEGLSVINPDLVGSVEFSTGGFGAEYADRMSSALDITYRQPESFEGSLGLSLMGGNIAIGQSSGAFSQLHGIRYKKNNSLLSSMETKGEYDPSFFDYQTNLTLKLGSKWSMAVLGNIAINKYNFTPQDRTTNFGTANDAKQFKVYFDGQEKDRFETFFGAFTLGYKPSSSTDLRMIFSGFLNNELVTYDISGEYWLDQAGGESNGSEVGGELGVGRYHEHARNRLKSKVFDVTFQGLSIFGKNRLSYGLSFKKESIMERSREWERRDSAGYSLPFDPGALKVVYNLSSNQDLSSTRFAAFIQDNIRFNASAGFFNLNAGIRLSYWDYNKEFLFSPRLSFGFVPERNDRWTFRFATGLYYQSPFYKEFRKQQTDPLGNTTVVLNKDIKSQRSLQFILGTDYTFRTLGRPFRLTAEAYYKALSDLIPYEIDNLKLVYSGQNQSKGYAMGLDFKLFGQFVPGSDSWISFSLMKTNEDLNGVNVPRPNDRRYGFALYFTDYFPKIPRLKFSLRGIFNDGLPVTAPRSTRDKGYFRTPAYKRVDVGLSYGLLTPLKDGESREGFWRHFKSIWLGFDVFNLFDISNVSSYYWVTDVNGLQYAVPNYLTRRQFNVRLTIDF